MGLLCIEHHIDAREWRDCGSLINKTYPVNQKRESRLKRITIEGQDYTPLAIAKQKGNTSSFLKKRAQRNNTTQQETEREHT